nr:unnamed protein product [Callosobruchus chinensis]
MILQSKTVIGNKLKWMVNNAC